jgi:hypothetical protein
MPAPTLDEQLDAANTLEKAIAVLQASSLPPRFKQGKLAIWAARNGYKLTAEHYAAAGKK